jgi:hypothetical protein
MAEFENQPRPDQPRPGSRASRPRRRRRRIALAVLLSVGTVVLLLVVLVSLAPTLASGYIPAIAQQNINENIQGRATVGGASLSWFGAQRIGPISIVDPDGRPVADIEIESSRGLFGIIGAVSGMRPLDLGTTTVTGSATIIRRPDGTLQIQDILKPSPDAEPQEVYLPPTLSARFILDGLDVTFIDERQLQERSEIAVVRIPALAGEASITNATRASASVAGHFLYGPSARAATQRGGSLQLTAAADNLTAPDGRLLPAQATYDASLDAVDVSVAVADVLADMQGRLVQGVGRELQAQVRMQGTLESGRFHLVAQSPGLEADLRLVTTDGVLRTPQDGRINLRDGGALTLIPGFSAALAAQEDVTFEQLPGATLSISNVNIPLPLGGRPLDLRGGSFAISLETGATVGRVRIPGPQGQPQIREYRLAPVEASIASRNLAERITVQAQTAATLGGESAGDLEVDLVAVDPLDARGRPRPTLARDFSGVARLSGFATIILQPFVQELGVNLAQDVGPSIDFLLRADATAASETPETATPTRLSLMMRSQNITGGGEFLLSESVLTSQPPGFTLEVGTLGPLISRIMAEQGLIVDDGAGLSLAAQDVRIDFGRLFETQEGMPAEDPAAAAGPDLRALAATLELQTTPTSGRIAIADQPVRRWDLSRGRAHVDAADLQRGVRLQASTSARLDGEPAGALNADIRMTELIDLQGRTTPGFPAIAGRASLTDVATSLLQPLLEPLGLDLLRSAGPRLGITLTATSEAAPASPPARPGGNGPALPRSIIDVAIQSDGITGAVPLAIDGTMLRTRGEGARVSIRSPGTLLGPAALDAGLEMSAGGFLRIIAREFALDLSATELPLLDRAAGEVEIAMGEFALRPLPSMEAPAAAGAGPAGSAINLQQLFITTRIAPGRVPRLTLRGSGNHEGAAFFTQGNFQLVGLDGDLDFARVRPLGQLELRNIPSTLVMLVLAAEPRASLDTPRLVQDLIGPSVSINLDASQPPQAGILDRRVALSARSQRFTAQAAADLSDRSLDLRQFDLSATVAPALAATLLETFLGQQLEVPPQIDRPARFAAALQPFSIPLVDGTTPDFRGAGAATLTAALEGQLVVGGIVLAGTPEHPPQPIGTLAFQDWNIRAEFPLGSLAPDSPAAPTRFVLTGTVLGAPEQRLLSLSSQGQATVAGGRPVGPLNADIRLEVADVWRLDEILAQDGMLAQALGRTLNIDAAANVNFPPAPPPGAAAELPAAPAVPSVFGFDRAALRVSLSSPRLTMAQPLRMNVLNDRATLEAPAVLQWTMHQDWANRHLLGAEPGAAATPQDARFAAPTPVSLNIARLTVARGEDVGPMLQGIFESQVDVSAASADMNIAGVPTRLTGLSARITGGRQPGTLGFNLRIQDAGGGPGPDGRPAVQFAGGIYQVADQAGHPTFETAALTVEGAAQNIPTAIIDNIAAQDGMLVDSLGPLVNLSLNARGVSRDGGAVNAVATSERARAELSGIIRDGMFITDRPGTVTLSIITPQLGQRLTRGLPLLGDFQKTTEEEPASVTLTNLTVPLDGDLRRLNGRIAFDPGEARFAISQQFTPVVRFLDERQAGVVGRRIQPISIAVNNGVLSYDRFNIAFGDFTLGMQGNVNLVTRQLDVLTFIPVGAVREEMMGDTRRGLGGVLGQLNLEQVLSTIPFRVRGSFESFRVEPDLQYMTQQLQRELLRPERLLGGAAQDILERLNRNGNNGNNQQPPPNQQPGQTPPPPAPDPAPEPAPAQPPRR